MKMAALLLAFGMLAAPLAAPADALSCIEPEPIDWSERFPRVDAAYIGVIESVKRVDADSSSSTLLLEARVIETLHGREATTLEYAVANFDPWGPYYEVGEELAIVLQGGRYVDGNQELCGPWFGPEELRAAAAEYGGTPQAPLGSFDFLRMLAEHLIQIFVPWIR